MFGILVSAFNVIVGFVLRGVVVKFLILTAIYYVVTWIAESVLTQLDISSLTGLQTIINSLPDGLLYFMGVFRFDVGLPLILGAMLTAFIIRRLPIIG
jgi:hypothetical protein